MFKVGYVVRKDGTVPFDDALNDEQRILVIAAIIADGYEIEVIPNSRDVKIKDWNK